MSAMRRGPASRSKIACKRCRDRHIKCDQQRPCGRCQRDGSSCLYGDQTTFTAKEWSPEEVGLPRVELAVGSSPVIDGSAPYQFINENETIQDQYAVITTDTVSPIASPNTLQHRTPSIPLSSPSPSLSYHMPVYRPPPKPITSELDAFFLDRYCHIVGPWFDLLDSERHFSYVVPHLALSHPLLLLSGLACAAKQHYLTSTQRADTALAYYDDALRMLTAALEDVSRSSSTAVFASCLLLAHCEMIDASNKDWHLHLSGTFSLVSTQGWNGRSGGLAQACFWIYCRMDVLSSLATATPTRLDTSIWLPTDDEQALRETSGAWTVDTWSNYVVLLLAQTHNLLCAVRHSPPTQELFKQWHLLSSRISAHEQRQPWQFNPLALLDVDPTNDENPFQSLRYVSDAVCAAVQMFDLTRILLLLARPEHSRHERLARFEAQAEAARMYVDAVVANSVFNARDISWVNAVQLLTSAGLALVGWRKRKALVKCLHDIHVRTGWNTRGNVEGLLEWWGWGRECAWREVQEEVGYHETTGECFLRAFEMRREPGM
ncbi:hypothetical protein K440DRAFT_31941 [Wilcoxina mikolae CBS 423.85]|nr:hypothetical protein K440DRAFT_31941 [Wilcoxina mikolae CBS 423.85]